MYLSLSAFIRLFVDVLNPVYSRVKADLMITYEVVKTKPSEYTKTDFCRLSGIEKEHNDLRYCIFDSYGF